MPFYEIYKLALLDHKHHLIVYYKPYSLLLEYENAI
jgi:hypothetical protein